MMIKFKGILDQELKVMGHSTLHQSYDTVLVAFIHTYTTLCLHVPGL